jgi:hypothetical protein
MVLKCLICIVDASIGYLRRAPHRCIFMSTGSLLINWYTGILIIPQRKVKVLNIWLALCFAYKIFTHLQTLCSSTLEQVIQSTLGPKEKVQSDFLVKENEQENQFCVPQ